MQEPLAEHLRDAGFEVQLLEAEPGRPNLVADLAGEADGDTLCLLGHVDTVPADADEWTFSPWSGDVVDGEVRGRGAQDMKGQVAAEAAAAIALAKSGWRPASGALKLVITADEEMGAALGAQWLCCRAARRGSQRPGRQRGRRGGVRARRPALLHPLRRREGRQSLPTFAPAASPGTPRCRRSVTTRC